MKDLLLLIETSGATCSVAVARADGASWALVAEVPSTLRHDGDGAPPPQPEMQHTALLLPLIREVLHEALGETRAEAPARASDGHQRLGQAGFARLAAVGVSSGPGSYTALRAGLSSAKGLALALSIPLLRLDTLAGLATAAREALVRTGDLAIASGAECLVLVSARRDEVYYARFSAEGLLTDGPAVGRLDEAWYADSRQRRPFFVCGPDNVLLEGFAERLAHGDGPELRWVPIPLLARNLLAEGALRISQKDYDGLASVTPTYLRPPHITQAKARL